MKYILILIIIYTIFYVLNLYSFNKNYKSNNFYLDDNTNWGFIILRHVSNNNHDKLWIENYYSIRKLYKNKKIIIIDDNSNYNYVSKINLHNTIIIDSEYKKRGELLPYYYYLKYKWFDCAVIIHDSCFINKKLNIEIEDYISLMHFVKHSHDNIYNETRIIKSLNNYNGLLEFYNKKEWNGCFGGMSIITYSYLNYINEKHNLKNLINHIKNRDDRKSFERVLACILDYNNKDSSIKPSLLGDIFIYLKYGKSYDYYLKYQKNKTNKPFIKVWSSR